MPAGGAVWASAADPAKRTTRTPENSPRILRFMRPLLTDPIARCSATTWRASSLIGVLPTSRAEYRRPARPLSSNGHVVTRHGWTTRPGCPARLPFLGGVARSRPAPSPRLPRGEPGGEKALLARVVDEVERGAVLGGRLRPAAGPPEEVGARGGQQMIPAERSEEHTSELQSHLNLVCRLLLEKKNKSTRRIQHVS